MKTALALCLLLGALGAAQARPREHWAAAPQASPPEPHAAPQGPPPQPYAAPRHPGMSAENAALQAQRRYGGRVLAVRPEGQGYRVKLLKDGEVRSVYVGN
jgi:hypothetical protein